MCNSEVLQFFSFSTCKFMSHTLIHTTSALFTKYSVGPLFFPLLYLVLSFTLSLFSHTLKSHHKSHNGQQWLFTWVKTHSVRSSFSSVTAIWFSFSFMNTDENLEKKFAYYKFSSFLFLIWKQTIIIKKIITIV